jgi:hypothetical protein
MPRLEDEMLERPFDSMRPWEDRPGFGGMTTHMELGECLENPKDYQEFLEQLEHFANGSGWKNAEDFRTYVRACVDNLRARRDEDAREARRGA